jgi:hypothetical protein
MRSTHYSPRFSNSFCRYTPVSGQASCVGCTAGTLATAENTGCTSDYTCPIGSGQITEGGSCEVCPSGKHNGAEDDSACVPCAAGTYIGTTGSTSSGDCVDCEAGKYSGSVDGVSECTTCDAGKANANTASTEVTACQDCGVGKYSGIGDEQVRPPRARASEVSAKQELAATAAQTTSAFARAERAGGADKRANNLLLLRLLRSRGAQATSFSCARFAFPSLHHPPF